MIIVNAIYSRCFFFWRQQHDGDEKDMLVNELYNQVSFLKKKTLQWTWSIHFMFVLSLESWLLFCKCVPDFRPSGGLYYLKILQKDKQMEEKRVL